ncbi:uncharacterized protein B0J16DRAFT_21466 [Fusarium flagelliforme]|uniref:Oxidoreductase n=1 Tax=Fusarium flagelliforme TaxID=2675880 RepID=A0A395MV71_9HYPO|nr:uncharacterized protein B0J16DRAFT_21466 [Fusarium flagelliforme]KAH7197536.1 hypothetical protein B0J16DRAFT_21466 [Fusarium flagelliforme]RFN51640.1 oxidoreductase [Fusarium flagelliforme]
MGSQIQNKAASGVPYFTPAQEPPAGTPLKTDSAPTLFKPLRTRGVELQNRFVVSPMCTYSAQDGHLTDFHLVHLGQFALQGAGLVFVEATAVEPRGRISPEDSGLWEDSQIVPLKRITDFIHSQNTKAAIQLAHAGRKASTVAPWIGGSVNKALATKDVGGWPDDIVAPSAISFADDFGTPHELTTEEIKALIKQWQDSAVRAVKAGFDVIEIHAAHGYLLHQFLSPLTNKRTDQYGGSFENRTRLLFEITEAIRAVIPEELPLWVRISATEWMEWNNEPSWDLESSIRLAKQLPALGVDVLDISSGGNLKAQKIKVHQTLQTDLAGQIREALRTEGKELLIGTVGYITDGPFARSLVEENEDPKADLVLAARQFLREPDFVLSAADQLDVEVKWPVQYQRATPKNRKPHSK